MPAKQNLLQISRNQEKCIIKFIGDWNKTQCTGSTYPQHKMLVWQTGSNAIITYQSVPKECVVKVVSESGKRELFARQLTPREGPEQTWFHRSSNALRLPRETERKLQVWESNPIPSESRTWPKEEFEQSVDLQDDGIPNDEIYKDEQYMQRIAEQVQKLVNTERILKEDPPGTTF